MTEIENVNKIFHAIRKCGQANRDKAHSHLGDELWEVVEQVIGWDYLCDLDPGQYPYWREQIRETLLAFHKRAHE